MRKTAVKIAISLPPDLYRAVESKRRKCRLSRSAFMQEAVRRWLAQQGEAELDRQYQEAYRRMPETPEEIASAQAAAVELFSTIEW